MAVVDAPLDTQEARGAYIIPTGGGQHQDNSNMSPLELPNPTKTASSSSLHSPSKGATDILDLRASEDEGSGTSGAQKPDSLGPIQSHQLMRTKILSMARGAMTEAWKKAMLNPAETLRSDPETEKPPPMKQWRKRKMDHQTSHIPTKIKIHLPDRQTFKTVKALDIKTSGSRAKGLQTDRRNTQSTKAQAPRRTIAKEKMQAKWSREPLHPVPKNHLAMRMMESVKVFHPLGKGSISTTAAQKAPSSDYFTHLPVKPASMSSRPILNTLPKPHPKPLGNPSSGTLSRAKPAASLTKPPPSSLAKPSLKPILVPQPLPRAKPQQASLQRNLFTAAGRTSALESRPGISRQLKRRPNHSQAKGPVRTTATFHPKNLPRDHSLGLKYYQPPPVLPFKIAFQNWRPPPKDLEVSTPITKEQRPRRELIKQQAQKEREAATQWTALGCVQFFEERRKAMETCLKFGFL